jgi:GNAT superfamily N-acetyltransferase
VCLVLTGEWRWLGPADFDAVMSLRQQVLTTLPDSDLYVREDDEPGFVRAHLDGNGFTLGLAAGGDLVAYAAVTTVLTDADMREYASVRPRFGDCVLAATMVHPVARGNGVQRQSIDRCLARAQTLGLRRMLVEVSLRNTASIATMLKVGMLLRAAVEYPDGRRRYLFTHDIASSVGMGPHRRVLQDVEFVRCGDWDGSRASLKPERVGRGLVGSRDDRFILVAAR